MKGGMWKHSPVFLALFFCVYAYALILSSVDAHNHLRSKETARAVAETEHRATMLADYLVEWKRDLLELTEALELKNYLSERSRGQPAQASRRALSDLLMRILATQMQSGKHLHSRYAYIDASGNTVADTAPDAPLVDMMLVGAATEISVDPRSGVVALSTPVVFNGVPSGHLVGWSKLEHLTRHIQNLSGKPVQLLLFTPEGHEISESIDSLSKIPLSLINNISMMPNDRIEILANGEDGSRLVAVRHAVHGAPLVLATLQAEEAVFEKHHEDDILIVAGIFPPLILVATVLVQRMRRRAEKMELELRASQGRLMEIADNLVEGIVLVDRNGQILFLNLPAVKITGSQEPSNAFAGQPLDSLFSLYAADRARNFEEGPWRDVILRGRISQNEDTSFIAPKGNVFSVAYSCTPFEDHEHGKTAIISFRNIEQLKQARHDAMQSSRMASVGQLAAGIAHEINTPIQYVSDNLHFIDESVQAIFPVLAVAHELAATTSDRTAAQAFEKSYAEKDIGYLVEELPNAVHQSLDGVTQVARIVLSMKEFSHPGGAGKNMADINRALGSTITVSRNSWKHVAKIETDFEPGLPMVYCRIGEMNQVFLNLIVNATQAIEGSGKALPGAITIKTRSADNEVLIEIADSGTGVPLDLRDRIFDPFFTTKKVGKGTGQGLAICYDVVANKHGGSIKVGGIPGEGAVFTIRLPVSGEKEEEDS